MANKRVYLDHAATTPIHPEVIEEIYHVMKTCYGNPSSIYSEGQHAKERVETARDTVAEAINASGNEIYFTASGTESDNWAVKGAALKQFGKKMHVITSAIEHHAVLHSVQALEKLGYEATYLPVDENGIVKPDDLDQAIRPDTAVVSIMMANNEIGTIQPIKKLAAICRNKGVLFHTDAVQAGGAIPIDVRDLGVDMLSLSGHKFNAPKGVGMLYIRKGVRINNYIDGGGQERGKRAGTENVPYIAGLAKAMELSTQKMETNYKKITEIRDALIKDVMEKIPHVRLNGHPTQRLPGNVNFSFEFVEGESLLLMLDHEGFSCSSGSACTSGSLDPSHVLLAIGLPHEIAHGSLRISISKTHSKEEVLSIVPPLKAIIEKLRAMSPLYEDYLNNKKTSMIPCTKCFKEEHQEEE